MLGFTLPEQYTSRSAFSETLMQLLLIGGLCLLIDSFTLESTGEDTGAVAMPRADAGDRSLRKAWCAQRSPRALGQFDQMRMIGPQTRAA